MAIAVADPLWLHRRKYFFDHINIDVYVKERLVAERIALPDQMQMVIGFSGKLLDLVLRNAKEACGSQGGADSR